MLPICHVYPINQNAQSLLWYCYLPHEISYCICMIRTHGSVGTTKTYRMTSVVWPLIMWGQLMMVHHTAYSGSICNTYGGIESCKFMILARSLYHINSLVQDCSNPSALAMELLQSCTKPSIYSIHHKMCTFLLRFLLLFCIYIYV